MQWFYGGVALSEAEVVALLEDPRVIEKTDLVSLYRAVEAHGTGSLHGLYVFWPLTCKWQFFADGAFWDVLHGPLARVRAGGAVREAA